jgi:hypothetical protein
MSIISRNALKAEFISGTAATELKFGDLFDSNYNRNDDSIMQGPSGLTGTWGMQGPTGGTGQGLLGPTGATYYQGLKGPQDGTYPTGLWLGAGSTPGSSGASGNSGQVLFDSIGGTAYMYVHNGTQWLLFTGSSNF